MSREGQVGMKRLIYCVALMCLIGSAGVWFGAGVSVAGGQRFCTAWPEQVERVWVGPEFWANRLQDWRICKGRLECMEGRANKPMRTVHLLTRRLREGGGEFMMQVETGLIGEAAGVSKDAAVGFLIGAGGGLDWRAAALVHHSSGEGGGVFAGVDSTGHVFVRDFGRADFPVLVRSDKGAGLPEAVRLQVEGRRAGTGYTLVVRCVACDSGQELSSVKLEAVDAGRLVGDVALVSHPGKGKKTGRFWFRNWVVEGGKFGVYEDHLCGPVISTQYTLSRNILKMTAQVMPIGMKDSQIVCLEVKKAGRWEQVATAPIIVPGWTATFRVANWDSSRDWPYRVVYELKQADGQSRTYLWSGTVRRDPVDKPVIVVAGFTGNHNVRFPGLDRGKYKWRKDWLWFPHSDLVEHVAKHKPDVLFFSGDQVYEGASPTGADRSGKPSSYLDYMYKWYLWCWAYRELTKDIVCVCIPDDHDVYQGNLWGAGGRKTNRDNKGGYVMPAGFVKMVERTQTSHLPDPYDPTPIEQGIGVYYTSMTYGRISFAILEDRKFKSGCAGLVPPTKSGRPDHVIDPNFDPRTADVPGATLLGQRQLKFLREWGMDWLGADMKMALSQTMFAGMATHHGGALRYLVADYDSNGWPQSGRNRALAELRRCFAFHLGGDQHLATLVHHGIEDWDDACWSFCVPSIANFYLRAWWPKQPGRNRQPGMPEYTGQFFDGFGNRVTVWAATNPDGSVGREPAALHNGKPGYGIVRLDKQKRTITVECWPRYADPDNPRDKQYLGWPKTIRQEDNYGRKAVAYLPTVEVKGLQDPVISVIEEDSGEVVYTLRIKGTSWRPKVFKWGRYTLKVGDPDVGKMKTIKAVEALKPQEQARLEVVF